MLSLRLFFPNFVYILVLVNLLSIFNPNNQQCKENSDCHNAKLLFVKLSDEEMRVGI